MRGQRPVRRTFSRHRFVRARQVDAERSADAQLTADRNAATTLLDDPVDGRQSEASASVSFLGSEEWLENLRHGFFVHPGSRVRHGKKSVTAWPRARVALRIGVDVNAA